MTLEHVPKLSELARSAFRLLRPGGAFVTVTHDYRSAVNRLLGKRSPIIDLEHLQLLSRSSPHRMFETCGFKGVSIQAFKNRYALRYWFRLAPLPRTLTERVVKVLDVGGLASAKVSFNVGNLVAAGFKG